MKKKLEKRWGLLVFAVLLMALMATLAAAPWLVKVGASRLTEDRI